MEEKTDRELAHETVDAIFDTYEAIKFSNIGVDIDRIAEAQRCVRMFWSIYELSLWWAEDLFEGRHLWENDDTVKRLCTDLYERHPIDKDWFFEVIGAGTNRESADELVFEQRDELLDYLVDSEQGWVASVAATQSAIFEMTQSRSVKSIWPGVIHSAFFELKLGGKPSILQPQKKFHGDAGRYHRVKADLVCHVLFKHGQGASKTLARQTIGADLGVSEHALKKWELDLRKLGPYAADFEAAFFAGYYDETISDEKANRRSWSQVMEEVPEDSELRQSYYGWSLFERMWWKHHDQSQYNPQDLRRRLKEARANEPD